jgi:hypothetical protein
VEKRRAQQLQMTSTTHQVLMKILALSSVGYLAEINGEPLSNAVDITVEVDTFMFFSDSCHVLYLLSRNSEEQQKV